MAKIVFECIDTYNTIAEFETEGSFGMFPSIGDEIVFPRPGYTERLSAKVARREWDLITGVITIYYNEVR